MFFCPVDLEKRREREKKVGAKIPRNCKVEEQGGKETKNRFRVLSGRDKGINYTGKWTCSDEIVYLWICKNVVYSYSKYMRELWPTRYLGTNVLTNSSAFWFTGRRNFGLIYALVDEEIEIETRLFLF